MVTPTDIEEEVEEVVEEIENEVERAVGLRVAIKRAFLLMDKINATAERLEEEGFEVPDIEANLTEAKTHLR